MTICNVTHKPEQPRSIEEFKDSGIFIIGPRKIALLQEECVLRKYISMKMEYQ